MSRAEDLRVENCERIKGYLFEDARDHVLKFTSRVHDVIRSRIDSVKSIEGDYFTFEEVIDGYKSYLEEEFMDQVDHEVDVIIYSFSSVFECVSSDNEEAIKCIRTHSEIAVHKRIVEYYGDSRLEPYRPDRFDSREELYRKAIPEWVIYEQFKNYLTRVSVQSKELLEKKVMNYDLG